ncbi:hypothetical protein ACFHW0_29730 [Micromonospora sp. LOL_025]|uniref:hypothetical protein n=1 Tax=Micromonospora sp. LOL_025 TaxID=3345413 RepID=UPI003A879BBE
MPRRPAPASDDLPVRSHSDLLAGNVLVEDGRLCGLYALARLAVGEVLPDRV